jgi:hypothetical protein
VEKRPNALQTLGAMLSLCLTCLRQLSSNDQTAAAKAVDQPENGEPEKGAKGGGKRKRP